MTPQAPRLLLPYLLTLLAALMGTHMALLMVRDQGCRQYEQALLQRLLTVKPASTEARNIRNEIQNFFDGRYKDCTNTTAQFSDTADKYLAVILSLLTGAGVAGGIAAAQKRQPQAPGDGEGGPG